MKRAVKWIAIVVAVLVLIAGIGGFIFFRKIADVVIMDEDGSTTIPVEGGTHLKENYVGAHFPEYDGFLVLSHFKGHAMAGFGGAIKNISIGIGSKEGKCLLHTAESISITVHGTSRRNLMLI